MTVNLSQTSSYTDKDGYSVYTCHQGQTCIIDDSLQQNNKKVKVLANSDSNVEDKKSNASDLRLSIPFFESGALTDGTGLVIDFQGGKIHRSHSPRVKAGNTIFTNGFGWANEKKL